MTIFRIRFQVWALLAAGFLILAGCSAMVTPLAAQGLDQPASTAAATVQPSQITSPTLGAPTTAAIAQPSQTVSPTRGALTAANPSQTIEASPGPISSPTVAATPNPQCLAPKSHAAFQPGDFSQLPAGILAYLNAGATTEELNQALYDAGVANQPMSVAAIDMTGDGQQDVVVSIFDPASRRIPPTGALMIYTCTSGSYQLSFQLGPRSDQGAPGIRFLQDMNADGKSELVTSMGTCQASVCTQDVQILAWNGSGFENDLVETSTDLADPDIQVQDLQGKGVYALAITAGRAGSNGDGLQRKIIRTWVYDANDHHWKSSGDVLAPSNYRLYVLQDADAAFRRGEYDQALAGYRSVKTNQPPLLDWVDPASERANLGAYASYKIVMIDLLQGHRAQAETDLAQMKVDYPTGTPQNATVEMTSQWVQSYASGGAAAACSAVKSYASGHAAQILDPLGSKVFGPPNLDYQPEDMCP